MSDRSYQHALYRASVAQLSQLLAQAPEEIQKHFLPEVCYHIYEKQSKKEMITWPLAIQLQHPDRDYTNILAMLDLVVSMQPDNVWAYILRARALWGIQYYAASYQDLYTALRLDGTNYTVKLLFCYTVIFLEKLPEAEHLAQVLRDEYGETYSTLLMMHFLYEKQGIHAKTLEKQTQYFSDALFLLRRAKMLYPTKRRRIQEHEERILERLSACMDNP